MAELRSLGTLLLFISWFYLLVSYLKERQPNEEFRTRLLKATTLMGVFVWLVTEMLSSVNRLTPSFAAAAWLGSLVLLVACRRSRLSAHGTVPWTAWAIGGIVLLLAAVAWTAPPNNWDSMTYHMARVMHWKANASVAFFPTHILRELYQYPFAEMWILQTVLLSGGDRLANLPQFFALVGCAVGVSAIVGAWKGTVRAQWLACLLTVTLPMAVLQSTSTQNDLVTAFWLTSFAAFSVLLFVGGSPALLVYAAASLGLAVLTKPVAPIWALPFALLYLVLMFRRPTLWPQLLFAVFVAAVLIAPTGWRNFRTFGSPLPGDLEGPDYSVSSARHDVPGFLTVLTRNAALHLGAAPIRRWRAFVRTSALRLQQGLNVDENDPRLIWPGSELNPQFSRHEDYAGNFVHFLLATSAILLLLMWRTPGDHATRLYALALVMGFLLFSFVLRWQPYHSRLHLPVFVLAMPCIALAVERYLPRTTAALLSILLLVQATPFLFFNASRPVFGPRSVFIRDRVDQMFINQPELQAPYQTVASALLSSKCPHVGLMMQDGDTWEYPLWSLTGNRLTLEHVDVQNPSAKAKSPAPLPCLVVTMEPQIRSVEVQGRVYKKALDAAPLALWQ